MATIVITGANRGIGLELSRQAAARGDRVIAACRDPGKATQLAALAKAADSNIDVVPLDVTSDASVAAFRQRVGTLPVDALINNAGVMGGDRQTPLNMDFDDFAHVLSVNTIAPLRVTQALLPNIEAARGKIIVISSLMGSFSFTETAKLAYCTSKTAVNRVFRGLAQELAPKGVCVAILSPGWVRTDMGGPNAHMSVEDSARGLLAELDGLSVATTGKFRNHDRGELPW